MPREAMPISNIWEPNEKENFLRTLRMQTAIGKERYLGQKAKTSGVSKEDVLREVREYAKSKINFPEKVTYFHKTSIKNFQNIVEMGSLLSRSEIKKQKPDFELSAWSASNEVMMTKDVFDLNGELISRGLSEHDVGASGGGVTLVVDSRVTATDNFDTTGEYPTISNAPLSNVCNVVLVGNKDDAELVEKILSKNKMINITVALEQDWKREHYKNK